MLERMQALLLTTCCALAATTSAQGFDDPGPHLAGWQEVSFVSAATIAGRVYYPATSPGEDAPADPGLGYPLVGLIHGQSFEPSDYDDLSLHLASWGYVVCSIGPLGGALHGPPTASKKMRDMLHWFEDQAADPQSPFAGLANDAPWSVLGHSLGGQAVLYTPSDEPRVRAIVALEPYYDGQPAAAAKLAAFDGALLALGGEQDVIVPPGTNAHPMFVDASPLGRSVFVELLGSGHYGALDVPPQPLPDVTPLPEQHRVHRKLITAFLEAEVREDEDAYAALLGSAGAGEPYAPECSSDDAMLWAPLSARAGPPTPASALALGLGGRALEPAWLAVAFEPASIPTRAGLVGLGPKGFHVAFAGALDASGRFEMPYPIAGLAPGRTLYLQGLVQHADGLRLTRAAEFVGP